MAKLTVKQMIYLANSNISDHTELAECIGVKTMRVKSFLESKDSTIATAPIYWVEFWQLFKDCEGDESVILATHEKEKTAVKSDRVDDRPISGGEMTATTTGKQSLEGRRFVFTSAQNNTNIHENFFQSLLTYCKENDAELIVGTFIYNKNGFQNGTLESDDVWFDPKIRPFLLTEGRIIAPGLEWCGELNILPTAKYPLSGFEQYTGKASAIVPHAKISMESIATAKIEAAKLMYSTGAITQHNYIQKKAGQVAESEHCFGAVIVEIDEQGEWFARQIQTDESGSFQDLTTVYHPNKVYKDACVLGINWGDLHSEKSDYHILRACREMLDDLQPSYQFFHDCFDMTSRNHHNRKSGFFLAKMAANGETVEKDLQQCADVLGSFNRPDVTSVIVESNHDLALESWLDCNIYDYRQDPVNALTYLKLQAAKYEAISQDEDDFNLLKYALTDHIVAGTTADLKKYTFLSVDSEFQIAGIECGMHGHIGANGSRGSPKQFRKLAMRVNTGHTHSASIHGGVYTAGVTGKLDMGYNTGPSSWSHSHIVTYPNGMRSILTMKNGKYQA